MVHRETPSPSNETSSVPPPPLPRPFTRNQQNKGYVKNGTCLRGHPYVSSPTRDLWECLFDVGYRADVAINTDNGGVLYAHACVLGAASPVLKSMLKESRKCGHLHSISIRGVPYGAVKVFIQCLYSSCCEPKELDEYTLHLLVLSHAYLVPHLKQVCALRLEQGFLTKENVVDMFLLALLCDAPRLSLICHRLILKDFKSVTSSEGWKAMTASHPMLVKLLLKSKADTESMEKKWKSKLNERRTYLQLYEAMEALVHICRDGCRTIGPHDKLPSEDQGPCNYKNTCKALELLVRHFAGCKQRIPGGCIHCKRMWQLFELHSHLCADSDACKVPLCRNFKQRSRKKQKKDDMKWRILVQKVLRTKSITGAPFFHL